MTVSTIRLLLLRSRRTAVAEQNECASNGAAAHGLLRTEQMSKGCSRVQSSPTAASAVSTYTGVEICLEDQSMRGKLQFILSTLLPERVLEALWARRQNKQKSYEDYKDIATLREQIYAKTKMASG